MMPWTKARPPVGKTKGRPITSKAYLHSTTPVAHSAIVPRLLRRRPPPTRQSRSTATLVRCGIQWFLPLVTLFYLIRMVQVNLALLGGNNESLALSIENKFLNVSTTPLLPKNLEVKEDIVQTKPLESRVAGIKSSTIHNMSLKPHQGEGFLGAQVSFPSSSSQTNSTRTLGLLYPRGLAGGFANQVIRFIGLVDYAAMNNYTHLFLPSLWWNTRLDHPHNSVPFQEYPVPFDMVFDVNHWNHYSKSHPESNLPLLSHSLNDGKSDCWTTLADTTSDANSDMGSRTDLAVFRNLLLQHNDTAAAAAVWPIEAMLREYGFIAPLLNETVAMMTSTLKNPRRRDYTDIVRNTNCRNPTFYGGGTHAGRLWKHMMSKYKQIKAEYQNRTNASPSGKPNATVINTGTTSMDPHVRLALWPAPQWKSAAQRCVQQRLSMGTYHNNFIALHARIEMDMLTHNCGRQMENSLEGILKQIQNHLSSSTTNMEPLDGLLILTGSSNLVGRKGYFDGGSARTVNATAHRNLATLTKFVNASTGYPTLERLKVNEQMLLPLLQCGSYALRDHYSSRDTTNSRPGHVPQNHGYLVEAVMDAYNAIQAKVFVGTKGSSFSSHIWQTRALLGRGTLNFEYTKDGNQIQPLGQDFIDPHMDCRNPYTKH